MVLEREDVTQPKMFSEQFRRVQTKIIFINIANIARYSQDKQDLIQILYM